MIITAMAMYLNSVHGQAFDYLITFIGDIVLAGIISSSTTVKNLIKRDSFQGEEG